MIHAMRTNLLASILVLALSCFSADSVFKSFRVALASSGPLISSLVSAGVIPKDKADQIRGDFDAGAACGEQLEGDFKAIAKDDPQAKKKKFEASTKAMRCWRAVVDRGHFKVNTKLQAAADIADGILSSLVIFYSEPGDTQARVGAGGKRTTMKDSIGAANITEEEFEKKLKVRVKDLEKALQP